MARCWRCKTKDGSIHHIDGNHGNDKDWNHIPLCPKCHDLAQGICDRCRNQQGCHKNNFQSCWSFEDSLPPIHFVAKPQISETILTNPVMENETMDSQISLRKAKGAKELRKYLRDERLTPKQMILAKCCDCMNWYSDGKEDCQIPDCPLYPASPYGNHPIFKSRASQPMSENHLKALMKGRMRAKKDNSCSITTKEQTAAPSAE